MKIVPLNEVKNQFSQYLEEARRSSSTTGTPITTIASAVEMGSRAGLTPPSSEREVISRILHSTRNWNPL